MLTAPICKINLGLNVVEKRSDGYHNLETVFYPVPICDALEVFPMDPQFPSDVDCDLKVTNLHIEGDEQKNLVVKAYHLPGRHGRRFQRLWFYDYTAEPSVQPRPL